MPKLPRLYAVIAYMVHPAIQIGYKYINGGFGTVYAIAMEHPILNAHASTSKQNLTLFDLKSDFTHAKIPETDSLKLAIRIDV
jgi:hypothetical protein